MNECLFYAIHLHKTSIKPIVLYETMAFVQGEVIHFPRLQFQSMVYILDIDMRLPFKETSILLHV